MKIGNWLCFIFGHKFLFKGTHKEEDGKHRRFIQPVDYCIRCGKYREK